MHVNTPTHVPRYKSNYSCEPAVLRSLQISLHCTALQSTDVIGAAIRERVLMPDGSPAVRNVICYPSVPHPSYGPATHFAHAFFGALRCVYVELVRTEDMRTGPFTRVVIFTYVCISSGARFFHLRNHVLVASALKCVLLLRINLNHCPTTSVLMYTNY